MGCSMKYLEGKFHYICTYICLEKYIKDRFSIFSIYYFRITEAQYSDGNNLKPSLFSFIFLFFFNLFILVKVSKKSISRKKRILF